MRLILSAVLGICLVTSSAQAAPQIEQVDPAAVTDQAAKVEINKMKYLQKEVVIPKGGTVVWTNNDAMPHNVHFGKGDPENEIEGDMLRAGQSFAIKFNEAGVYPYICTPHPFMKATVKVE